MKKITFFLLALTTSLVSGQTTFDILWQQGINGTLTSLTIQTGDTVNWIWGNSAPYSVTSLPGSRENFDSTIIGGKGNRFSHTFIYEGSNDYQCDVNPTTMFGTITVVKNLSVQDKFSKNLQFYPNPVLDQLTIFSLFKLDSYKIYNVLGSLVSQNKGSGTFTKIDMTSLKSGMYFVTVGSGGMQSTFKVTKR